MTFLRSLLLAVFLTAGLASAHAELPVCTGSDLLEKMQTEHPQLFARLRAEADGIRNAKNLLWRINSPKGGEPSWLFGTVHLSDPRARELPPAAKTALDKASFIVIESTEAIDPREVARHMPGVTKFMVLPGETTLGDIIPAADLPLVRSYFDKTDKGFASISKLQPFVAALALSVPQCEIARLKAGESVLDAMIAADAAKTGAALAGLESLEDQFGAMASMPIDAQVDWLVQSVKLAPEVDDQIETTMRLYLKQDTGMLSAWAGQVAIDNGLEKAWSQFTELLIEKRNRLMAERARPFIEKGNAFIAVGAMHLAGDKGLVQLLRAQGYTVTPVN